jgi:hypothetical protein
MRIPGIMRIVVLALVGTAVVAGSMFFMTWRESHDVAALITPGSETVSAPVLRQDFPGYDMQPGVGHDGQASYVIARDPLHFADAVHWADRPRYRAQRILLPAAAWVIHPQGGGRGLVVAQWAVAVLGIALTGIGAALLARALGASADNVERLALFVPLLPASWAVAGLATPDQLALGLALVALAADATGYRRRAIALAILAVLAKETMIVVLFGWAVYKGVRAFWQLFVLPAAVAFTWWATLRVWFPDTGEGTFENSLFHGFVHSVSDTLRGNVPVGGTVLFVTMAVAIVALWKHGLRSPLGPVIAINLAMLFFLSEIVLVARWNGPRATGPLLALSLVALALPKRTVEEPEPATQPRAVPV